jgi:hypothetical protein
VAQRPLKKTEESLPLELLANGCDLSSSKDVAVAFRFFKPRFRCQHCGERHPSCIMFYDPGRNVAINPRYVERIRRHQDDERLTPDGVLEILKSKEALCLNCYRKRYHGDERRYSREQRDTIAELDEIKRRQGCSSCGERDPSCLDFHHRDGAEKLFNIYGAVKGTSRAEILSETEKCDVECANCHSKLHWDEREREKEKEPEEGT